MAWRITFETTAKKELAKLDSQSARRITEFLRQRLAPLDDPRTLGAALHGPRFGALWKYRVGSHRIIARIKDDVVEIVVVRIGDRKEIYK